MEAEPKPRPWQTNTALFVDRALALGATSFEIVHTYLAPLPVAPLAFRLSEREMLKYQLCFLIIGNLRSAREISRSSSNAWLHGHFLLASVGVRMLIELLGQLRWAERNVLNRIECGDLANASNRMSKLLLGSKSAIPLIRDERGPHPLVNVMDFVRAANDEAPGVADDYAFLCDSAHPSFAMHSWLLFAGPDYDNWTNPTFAKETKLILDRILRIGEFSIARIDDVSIKIATQCIPEISAEFGNSA